MLVSKLTATERPSAIPGIRLEGKHLTIQQLIDQHKVVLYVLLADLPEVGGHHVTHLVKKLEHHGGVDILLGDSSQPDVGTLDVEEARAGDVGDRRAHLLPGVDDIDAEGVHSIPPTRPPPKVS